MTPLIQRYKFSADPRAGEVLIQLMLASLSRGLDLGEAVIGVPGQRERTREQGFDHTAWLTKRLAERLQLPTVEAERLRETPSQRGLDRVSRRRNVKRAFAVNQPLPAAVMIVDDVMTTGATLESLALACRAAGARQITALAFARTPSVRI
ncbi:ComF family protein [Salinicola sp. CPA57]|uniref:ComF family protein n=1 Tax=Salinicola sp. CPA57 TaxID=1949080 RepID=UPI001E4403E9|nr:ComF family protein [Salinicola sp. CPA57]